MTTANDSIGVVVLEPNAQLLQKLCAGAQKVWGKYEVLPRQTGKELQLAADNLQIGLLVVRASIQRSSALIQNIIADLYADGTQLLIIQDTPFKLSATGNTSIAGMHFLSDKAGDQQYSDILALSLVRHCMPGLNKLV